MEGNKIKIERVWAMPSRWTFIIKPITKLLKEEINGGLWCDPFCGKNSPAQDRNDINPEIGNGAYCQDALTFLQNRKIKKYDGVLYDPPYSITQARMYGK